MARSNRRRSSSSTTQHVPGARTAPDASLPRVWRGVEYRPLADPAPARELFTFAAAAWPALADPGPALGAWAGGSRLVGVVIVERDGAAAFLHGPVVVAETDPLEIAEQLLAAAIDHATAGGVVTLFARPQGLDRVWIRFGFIPVPEVTLPQGLRGRPGVGLFAYRGGSALWSLRPTTAGAEHLEPAARDEPGSRLSAGSPEPRRRPSARNT